MPPRVAVVGCGRWGRNLVRDFAALGALDAVCDSDAAVAAAIAAEHGVACRDWGDLLADRQIQGLVIAAPAVRHAALVDAAIRAGKDVFVEKPLALSVEEGRGLCDLARREERILMVGHLLRYHPVFRRLKTLVEAGRLGTLRHLYSSRLNLGRVRTEENVLWSFAPHDISMILALTGEAPHRVTAGSGAYLSPGIADLTTLQLDFSGSLRAQVQVSWLNPFKEQKLVVVGEAAMAVFDDRLPWAEKLVLYDHAVRREGERIVTEPASGEAEAVEAAEPLQLECSQFLESIFTRTRPPTDGEEGLRVLEVLAMAEQGLSDDHGKERFPKVQVHPSAYIDEPCRIGEGTRIWHFCHLLSNVSIGRDCSLGQNVMVGPNVSLGDGCKIQNNVSLYDGVTLEDGVFCGPSCVFTNVRNPRAGVERKDRFAPTLVRRGATIGANATIVCGNDLGAYCMIAAGAVVTRDVPAHALMAGVPARRIGWVSDAGEVLGAELICPSSGKRYREAAPDRLEEISLDAPD